MGMKFYGGLGMASLAVGLAGMAFAGTARRDENLVIDILDDYKDRAYLDGPIFKGYEEAGYYKRRPFKDTDILLINRALDGDIADIPQNAVAKSHGKGLSKRAKRRNRNK